MLDLLEGLVLLWSLGWALIALRYLVVGKRHSTFVLMLVHFAFASLPLFLNRWIGTPGYLPYPGFSQSYDDPLTCTIYYLYIAAIPPFWWWITRWCTLRNQLPESLSVAGSLTSFLGLAQQLRPVFYLCLISPIVVLLFAPDASVYFNYGVVATETLSREAEEFYPYVALSALLTVVGGVGLLSSLERIRMINIVTLLPWTVLGVWLNGKRYMVIFVLFLVGYIFWQRGHLFGKRLIIAIIFSLLCFSGYSYAYQMAVRGISLNTYRADDIYENFRIDYGRDHGIKMAIFAEIYPEKVQILDYRGQSFLFYLTMYMPRNLWPDKPLPYAQYFTSAAFNQPSKLWGWGLTTSILEEAIANFGWFGLIIGPLIPVLICCIGESAQDNIVSSLTTLIASLFLTVQFSAFAPLMFIWVALCWKAFRNKQYQLTNHWSTSR